MKKCVLCSLLLLLLNLNLSALLPTDGLTRIECKIKRLHHLNTQNQTGQNLGATASLNWSGYSSVTHLTHPKKKSVSRVSGYWIVPTLHPTVNDSFSNIWVGIDGFSNKTVEQIGTAHNSISHAQVNFAWFEMFPRHPHQLVGFPVNPGDMMAAEVSYKGKGRFELSLYNYTQLVYTIVPSHHTKSHAAHRSSADWIVEAPVNKIGVLPLADFNTVTFSKCEAKIKGKTGSIKKPHREAVAITMAHPNLTIKADPTPLTEGSRSFSVNWISE